MIQFRRNNSDASVPVGGYEIMWIDIYIPPGSLATYEVEAFAPGNLSQTEENTMFLCDLRLIQVTKKLETPITLLTIVLKHGLIFTNNQFCFASGFKIVNTVEVTVFLNLNVFEHFGLSGH